MHEKRNGGNQRLKSRLNRNGYLEFWDEKKRRWVLTHRRVAEKKVGGRIFDGYEVHHKNKNRRDNRPTNLVILPPSVHRRVHTLDRKIERLEREIPLTSRSKRGRIYGQLRKMRAEKARLENGGR